MDIRGVKQRILRKLLECERILNSGSGNYHIQSLLYEMRNCRRNLNRIQSSFSLHDYNIIASALEHVITLILSSSNYPRSHYFAETTSSNVCGRPQIEITKQQLELLISQGFTAKKIAKEFGCSVSTIYKRCYEEGFKFRNKYASISNEELRNKIITLNEKYPNSGYVMMDGYLKSEGLNVQRKRIREVLAEIDPSGTARRWSRTIKRRLYKVATPNSLWHMDAHMKLSRWGFVTHGCIDGFSRTIIYVSCTTSITAQTVINLFVPAVAKYGFPSRVRSDHGFENLFVAILMNSVRGLHRGSHITGKSVHNQRIERLWADVFQQVIKSFYNMFYKMESEGILDPNNLIHRYLLHEIYLKEINNNLSQFKEAWNYHKIRTENNRTPFEIWIDGYLSNINTDHTAIEEIRNNQEAITHRIQNVFEQEFGLNTTAIAEEVNRTSETINTLQFSQQQLLFLEETLKSDKSNYEKYLICVNFFS